MNSVLRPRETLINGVLRIDTPSNLWILIHRTIVDDMFSMVIDEIGRPIFDDS